MARLENESGWLIATTGTLTRLRPSPLYNSASLQPLQFLGLGPIPEGYLHTHTYVCVYIYTRIDIVLVMLNFTPGHQAHSLPSNVLAATRLML